jgi:phospholipid/cholesterol/gamma-HCH transport system substrate-binding protein
LVELSNLAGQTTPVLASLRPVTGDLRQIAIELSDFADAVGPALASADPVLQRARELVAAASPVTAELRAAAGDVQTAARSTRTVVEALPEDVSNLLDFVRDAALAVGGRDSLSHYLRIFILATPAAVGVVPVSAPAVAAGPPVPAPSLSPLAPPAVAGPPAPALSDLTGQIDQLLSGGDRGSATGLTFTQEKSLLSYLLGAG